VHVHYICTRWWRYWKAACSYGCRLLPVTGTICAKNVESSRQTYFRIQVQAEESFEALEDMIEMETPLPLQHVANVHLYRSSVGAAANVGSLPPLLRSSVASVGAYEGSSEGSEGGYLDIDASMSEDASAPHSGIAQSSTSRPLRRNVDARGPRKGHDSGSSSRESYDDDRGNSDSDIYSSDSPTR
jgi:hypothetical protein